MERKHENAGALTLTRRVGESIIIMTTDGPIKVTLADTQGKKGRIRIHAPAHVEVHREETIGKYRPAGTDDSGSW